MNLVGKRTYFPDRGDFVWINFEPKAGIEIGKRRPALVLSPVEYNRRSGLCIAVPTSTDLDPGEFWLRVPDGLLPDPSLLLCDYVKSLDWEDRDIEYHGPCPDDLLDEVTVLLLELLDPTYK